MSGAGGIRPDPRSAHRGFTLIELMVVISIIGILIALLMPAVRRVYENAQESTCRKNLHELYTACTMYATDHDGSFPYYSPEPAASIGLCYPRYVDQAKLFRCPCDQSPVPIKIDVSLTGADVRGPNGPQISYDSCLDLALPQDSTPTTWPLIWDWYGGLESGEGTDEQRTLNNHRMLGGNVAYFDGHVSWVSASTWSQSGSDRTPDPSSK